MGDSERRDRGRKMMGEVYAWENVPEIDDPYLDITVEHLFGDIWSREGLSMRDRRMLVLGVIAALGQLDVLPVQIDAILSREELTPAELREVVIFLTHYVGWPRGSSFNTVVEQRIRNHKGSGSKTGFPGRKGAGDA